MSARATAEPRGLRREVAAADYFGVIPLAPRLMARDLARGPRVTWPSGVYAIQVRGHDLVKIGYSCRPARRWRELENGSGMTRGLVPLLVIGARPAEEGKLHRRFAERRLFGEWFRLSGPVAEWVNDATIAIAEGRRP